MSDGIYREESLRRYRSQARREDVPLTIGTGRLVALWAVVVLLLAVAGVFALVLTERMGSGT
ncbi:hypothetical protein ACFQ08_42405 [Streptosporangium algeriense]|uniref:Uncharacterized protein n=1 Tax=Streptosporangium algeriense TaxID=1682748 RepID=A0ABW3E7D2_9ACTN